MTLDYSWLGFYRSFKFYFMTRERGRGIKEIRRRKNGIVSGARVNIGDGFSRPRLILKNCSSEEERKRRNGRSVFRHGIQLSWKTRGDRFAKLIKPPILSRITSLHTRTHFRILGSNDKIFFLFFASLKYIVVKV